MGRYAWSDRLTVEECRFFSVSDVIFELLRSGVLGGKPRKKIRVRMAYTIGKDSVDFPMDVTTTSCNFGGVRYWLGCPNCGKRVGKLYLPPGEKFFRCRTCYNLTYKSCKEHDKRMEALLKNRTLLLALMDQGDPLAFRAELKRIDKFSTRLNKLQGRPN